MRTRFDIHPFFLIDLMQMWRHREYRHAALMAADELIAAVGEVDPDSSNTTDGSDGGTDGGVVMLPTPQRRRELGYDDLHSPTQGNNQEDSDAQLKL